MEELVIILDGLTEMSVQCWQTIKNVNNVRDYLGGWRMKQSSFLVRVKVRVCLQTPCDYKRFRKGKWDIKIREWLLCTEWICLILFSLVKWQIIAYTMEVNKLWAAQEDVWGSDDCSCLRRQTGAYRLKTKGGGSGHNELWLCWLAFMWI